MSDIQIRNGKYKGRYSASQSKGMNTREGRFNLRHKLNPRPSTTLINHRVIGRNQSDSEELGPRRSSRRLIDKEPPCKWDNGVDWRCGEKECGDWVRAYPLLTKEHKDWVTYLPLSSHENRGKTSTNDKEARNIVINISKVNKLCKDIHLNNIGCTDEKKNNILINGYAITDAVWHPAPGFHEENL